MTLLCPVAKAHACIPRYEAAYPGRIRRISCGRTSARLEVQLNSGWVEWSFEARPHPDGNGNEIVVLYAENGDCPPDLRLLAFYAAYELMAAVRENHRRAVERKRARKAQEPAPPTPVQRSFPFS